jgi:hypothetical protein
MLKIYFSMLLLVSTLVQVISAPALKVHSHPKKGAFPLVSAKGAAPVWCDTSDYKVAQIAAGLFCEDVERITGTKPVLTNSKQLMAKEAVIIGTLGKSHLVDALVRSKKLDVAAITGQWESFVIATVQNPLPGVKKALVVAGSDRRGTAYGVFSLSEAMGVSPWYWWADVSPSKRDELHIEETLWVQGPPSVKYRGIFINDECGGLNPWAKYNFEKELGDIGPKTYSKIFELLLRLKANYCWPAMHRCTKAFNLYPENKVVADNYAIVMGSSHCEQILRNNETEWDKETMGEFNYVTNTSAMNAYWEERAKTNGMYENTYTLGIRGAHDYAMKGAKTLEERVKYTQLAINTQRDIIARCINPDTSSVPQVLCAYKEVLETYQNGLDVPDDVTLLWADDNHGFIRQLSNPEEQKRSGSSGVYYHISYFGDPEGWLWLSTLSPSLIAYEMQKAYAYGADRIWVFNVGDIKPAEKELTFAMEMAWDINRWTEANAHTFIADWSERTFGAEYAEDISNIMQGYYELAATGKPEHTKFVDYPEAEMYERITRYQVLADKAEKLKDKVPERLQDAWYQLVYYPVKGAALMNEYYLKSRLSLTEAARGNDKALELAAQAKRASVAIDAITHIYMHDIANGKWAGMMTWRPYKEMSETFLWPHADENLLQKGKQAPAPVTFDLAEGEYAEPMALNGGSIENTVTGISTEKEQGQVTFIWNSSTSGKSTLWFKTTSRIKWMSSKPSENTFWDIWLNDSLAKGIVTPIGNIWHATHIGPIWNRIGEFDILKGDNKLVVSLIEPGAAIHEIFLGTEPPLEKGYLQKVEAIDCNEKYDIGQATITVLNSIGEKGGISLMPYTTPSIAPSNIESAPYATFKFTASHDAGKLVFSCLPTQRIHDGRGVRFAVSVNGALPEIFDIQADEFSAEWQKNVLRGYTVNAMDYGIMKGDSLEVKVFLLDAGLVFTGFFMQ